MLENATVLSNGYGIRDPQEHMIDYPTEDVMGTEIHDGDEVIVSPDGEMVLKENLVDFLTECLGFEKKRMGA